VQIIEHDLPAEIPPQTLIRIIAVLQISPAPDGIIAGALA
jgi:hypothetical protein